MDESEYLKNPLDDQIDWYYRKSAKNQKYYKLFQLILIVSAAAIPLLSGYIDKEISLPYIIGALGFLVAIITALQGLYKFQETWTAYRTTCESLQHEKYLYLTKTNPYVGKNAFNLLVQRVEMLISQENSSWAEIMKKTEEKEEN
ncbi:MAG: DUF4231 domain-containing protein [Ignavibacteria bacterium]|nr:DUF4231 domain-containing protein [Ignavibacteria bacterium]